MNTKLPLLPRAAILKTQVGPAYALRVGPSYALSTTTASRVVVQLQSDLPLGAVYHVVGDAGLAAPLAVIGPRLRQVIDDD